MKADPRVDAYLAGRPDEQRALLQQLRERIARIVPEAEESISYGMPAFRWHDRSLIYYAGWKDHCSIYPLTDSFLAAHAAALVDYGRTKGSLHFTAATPLTDALLEGLVRSRLADLEGGRG
ncbi:MAG TPA: DUF1801 domain-containing protein [Candidatus Dormibacteraeota bacterium]|nr:DUF1801 domain-containing protein [Candidatus Dormibacteraeota bacterium]